MPIDQNKILNNTFDKRAHSPSLNTLRRLINADKEILDFSIPVNLGFPNTEFKDELKDKFDQILKYYPSEPDIIAKKLGGIFSLDEDTVIAGNGSTELFYLILGMKQRRILTPVPTFGRWTDAPKSQNHHVSHHVRKEEENFAINLERMITEVKVNHIDTVIISNPNNPTGAINTKEEIITILNALRHIELVIIDESFLDFNENKNKISIINEVQKYSNVLVLKSLGKSFGLHGVRLGILVGNKNLISKYKSLVPYWNINGVAEEVINLLPRYINNFEEGLKSTIKATQEMERNLRTISEIKVFKSEANFCFIKVTGKIDAINFRNHLLTVHGIYIRSCGNKIASKDNFFRVATRERSEANVLINAIKTYLK